MDTSKNKTHESDPVPIDEPSTSNDVSLSHVIATKLSICNPPNKYNLFLKLGQKRTKLTEGVKHHLS